MAKEDIHPQYQDVLFVDSSTGLKKICGSTLKSQETMQFQGKEYPVCRVAVSSSSHPFFVGKEKYMDTEGRVQKFAKKYQAAAAKPQAMPEEVSEPEAKKSETKQPAKKKK